MTEAFQSVLANSSGREFDLVAFPISAFFLQQATNYRLTIDFSAVGYFQDLFYLGSLSAVDDRIVITEEHNKKTKQRTSWVIFVNNVYGGDPVETTYTLTARGHKWTSVSPSASATWVLESLN
jgi:hypothetical protein